MASIFLSHNTKDKAAAQQLKAWLEAEKRNHYVFLDDDVQTGIKGGADWERTLYEQLRRCRVFIPLLTQNWNDSQWCFAEMTHARAQGKVILPVKLDPALETPKWFSDLQHIPIPIDLNNQDQSGFQRLQRALDEKFPWKPERSPYPGLLAFQTDDAAIYFGRDLEITSAIEKLEEFRRFSYSSPHFVLLLGASGSGKSSFARAGIMSHLKLKKEWLVVEPFMPRTNPIAELAVAFIKTFNNIPALRSKYASSQLEQDLAQTATANPSSETALLNLVRELRENSPNDITVLLIIDQAEELFVVSDPQRAKQFLALLRAAIEQADGRLMVLATMRSEFLGNFQQHPFRMDVRYEKPFEYETFTLDPLPTECFYEIIRKPAELVGLTIDDDLVERMVVNTGTNDALPLLAYTLRRLWDNENYRKDWRFELKEYLDLGGLEGSIRKAADEALNLSRRNQEELAALKGAFVPAMVKLSHEDDPVRQRARLDKLTPEAIKLLQPFINNRLLITDKDTDDHETLEVAHEALLRAWPQLVHWIDEDRDKLHLFNSLERAAKDWNDHNRQPDLLVHKNDRLKELLELVRNPRFQLREDSIENAYLIVCEQSQTEQKNKEIEERERRVKDAERIASEQKKSAQIFKRGLVLAGILLCFALFAVGYAFEQRKIAAHKEISARYQEGLAKEQTKIAEASATEAKAALLWSNLVFEDGKISPEEVETLWKLGVAEEPVRNAFALQIMDNEKLGYRFEGKLRAIIRAMIELDDQYAQKTTHYNLSASLNQKKQQIYILAASFLIRELASAEGLKILVESISRTDDTSQLAALENGLITLAAKIDAESVQQVIASLRVAIEKTDKPTQFHVLVNGLVALAANIDAESAKQVATWLLTAIEETNDPYRLAALSDSLVAFAEKIDAISVQQIVASLLSAIEKAENSLELEALGNNLATLVAKIDEESAQQIVASLLSAIEKAENSLELEALGNNLATLVAKIDEESAQQMVLSLLVAIEETNDPYKLAALSDSLVAFAEKIDAVSVQRVMASLLFAIEKTEDPFILTALSDSLVAFAEKIDEVSVQRVVASLLSAIEKSENSLGLKALGNSLVASAANIDAETAQQVVLSLLVAIEETNEPYRLAALSDSLVAFAEKIDAVSVQQVVVSLLSAIEKTEDPFRLTVLSDSLVAFAEKIDAVSVQRVVASLLSAIEKSETTLQVATLVKGLAALDVKIDAESTQRVATLLMVTIERTEDFWQLVALTKGLAALDMKLDAVSAQRVLTFLVGEIERAGDFRQLDVLVKNLVALDVEINEESAQRVLTFLVDEIERRAEDFRQLDVLVKNLVALDVEINEESAQKVVKSLLVAIEKVESSWELEALSNNLAKLVAKIDTESVQKVVKSLLVASWMTTWSH